MSLDSNSTREEVRAAMIDNASYLVDGDIAKCKAFITACIIWMNAFSVAEMRRGASATRMDTANVQRQLDTAQKWLASNAPPNFANTDNGSIIGLSVENFRC